MKKNKGTLNSAVAILGGVSGSRFSDQDILKNQAIVVFDFETTGLNVQNSRIIEIGAIKYLHGKEVSRFSELIYPGFPLPPEIIKITGIDDTMLKGKATIESVLSNFHEFLRGCVGVAHNAEFDIGMLTYESHRLGIGCDYTVFCTLKMARQLVKSERRNLDSLATHYGLSFESRHRSIGDILVTAQIFFKMLEENQNLKTFKDMQPYKETMPNI